MLNNFSLSLALIAGAASASQVQPHGGYGYSAVYDTYAPQYTTPQYTASGYGYSHQEPDGYYYQHETESPQTSHPNPWGTASLGENETAWWSTYLQYRPPIVPYKPAVEEPCYAICENIGGNTDPPLNGFVQFAQFPGQPIQVQGTFTGALTEGDNIYDIQINENGILGEKCQGAKEVDEFNPMQGVDKYGQPFTFQDPQLGRIDRIQPDDDTSYSFTQDALLQNLAGPDSIIGKALYVYRNFRPALTAPLFQQSIGCCVIVQDKKPDVTHHVHTSYPYPQQQPQPHYR